MISSGMAEILAALSLDRSGGLRAVPVSRCAEVLGVSGLAVSVLVPGRRAELVWRTGQASDHLDDLQITLGQGPSLDAAASGELILESDLAGMPAGRWPVFTPGALELGVRAVFAVPLQIGAIRLGVMLAHRDVPGQLDKGALADALAFAAAATEALLMPGSSGPGWLVDQPDGSRAQIHQATGMISAQLGVPPAEALIRMGARAFSQHRSLADVAADVVGRKLRFGDDSD